MKILTRIPCWPGWISTLLIGALALIPGYFYVQLMLFLISLVIAAYCLIYTLKKRKPAAAQILWGLLTSLVILGGLIFAITGGLILCGGQGTPDADCSYIIVLGAQVHPEGPSDSLQERIDATYAYMNAHPQTIAIVSGGKGDDEHISEALCMYQALTAMGIQPDRIILEDQATSTWENLHYSLDIIQQETGTRPHSVGVVSSEYHLFRTGLQAQEHDLTIVGIPSKTESFNRYMHYFIREIAGVWHYTLLGS